MPYLTEHKMNYLLYGFIPDRLNQINNASDSLKTYFFDLHFIMAQGNQNRINNFKKNRGAENAYSCCRYSRYCCALWAVKAVSRK
jgi:hypothetical protein